MPFRELALRNGARRYERAATVGVHPAFIGGLAQMVQAALSSSNAALRGRGRSNVAGAVVFALTAA